MNRSTLRTTDPRTEEVGDSPRIQCLVQASGLQPIQSEGCQAQRAGAQVAGHKRDNVQMSGKMHKNAQEDLRSKFSFPSTDGCGSSQAEFIQRPQKPRICRDRGYRD
ncbi:hypothetical protein EYF80_043992 [Liparis tanakae]|uniref:Uncharacterized protein n=1 Tax=Liparis tanakae TaxID=230148 RepID=A0A4Z2FZ30_9TELE|nr:hypothetical protein EYF80_043992 [Liparis tanakae]